MYDAGHGGIWDESFIPWRLGVKCILALTLISRCQEKGSRRPWEVSQSGHKRPTGRSKGSEKERIKGMYNQALESALHRNSGCQWHGWYQNAAQDQSRSWTPDRQIKDWWVHPRQKPTIEQMDKSFILAVIGLVQPWWKPPSLCRLWYRGLTHATFSGFRTTMILPSTE